MAAASRYGIPLRACSRDTISETSGPGDQEGSAAHVIRFFMAVLWWMGLSVYRRPAKLAVRSVRSSTPPIPSWFGPANTPVTVPSAPPVRTNRLPVMLIV